MVGNRFTYIAQHAPVTVSALNSLSAKAVQETLVKISQTPTLQAAGLFQPSESDICLLNSLWSSGVGVGCISTVIEAPSPLEFTVEAASRGYEQGDGISCGAADANGGAKTATITPLSVRSGWIFIVIAVEFQLTGFRQSSSSTLSLRLESTPFPTWRKYSHSPACTDPEFLATTRGQDICSCMNETTLQLK